MDRTALENLDLEALTRSIEVWVAGCRKSKHFGRFNHELFGKAWSSPRAVQSATSQAKRYRSDFPKIYTGPGNFEAKEQQGMIAMQQMLAVLQQQQQLTQLFQLVAQQNQQSVIGQVIQQRIGPPSILTDSMRSTPSDEVNRHTAESSTPGRTIQALTSQNFEFADQDDDNVHS